MSLSVRINEHSYLKHTRSTSVLYTDNDLTMIGGRPGNETRDRRLVLPSQQEMHGYKGEKDEIHRSIRMVED